MAATSSVQQTLQDLADQLAAAYPISGKEGVAPSPYPLVPPPSRATFRARVAEVRDAVERFRPVWSGNATVAVDDESRIKASGSMREWATNTALLAALPSLARLPAVSDSLAKKTHFALPPGVSVPSLLEARAHRLGLEVYHETLLDADDDPSGSGSSGGPREVLVLGGKALVVELELASPAGLEGDPATAPRAEDGHGHWTLVKSSTSISIVGAAEPLAVPALDAYLRPPLERLLALASPRTGRAAAAGYADGSKTPELITAQELARWESRLAAALASETVFAARPSVFDESAALATSIGSTSTGADPSVDIFPSLRLGRTTVKLEPLPPPLTVDVPATAGAASPSAPPRASRLPFLASSALADTSGSPTAPFLWEATFTPALVVPVCSASARSIGDLSLANDVVSDSARLRAHSFWKPPEGRDRAQRWTLDSQGGGLDQVAFERVGLASSAEAGALVEWARGWTWVLDTAEKVLDGTEGPPPASVASALEEISLESLVSILSPDTAIPVALTLPSSVANPSITLTIPHPSQSIAVQILLTPLATPANGAYISLRPVELEERVGRDRLNVLGQRLGGEVHAVVLWLLRRLTELEPECDEQADENSRETKRMRVD